MCTPCQGFPPSNLLGVGCSDTYGFISNGDPYWLGPPDEVDPWLGLWSAACSHFDRGEPPVASPADCDGVHSLTVAQASALGPVGHRMHVSDADLNHAGAAYSYQGYYVVAGEAEALRDDNLGWRSCTPSWNAAGNKWSLPWITNVATGSVLHAWNGATVSSAANGNLDGRLYVASRVTPAACGYHYEYALHNRDNLGGIDVLRVPLALGASVSGAGARDVDGDPLNDWTASVAPGEVVFSGPAQPWNTIYNVWFDADVGPATGDLTLEQSTGAPDLLLPGLETPTGSAPSFATYCTAGTSAAGCRATLCASGTPSASAPSGFLLAANDSEGGRSGLFFFAPNGRQGRPWGNGSSFQCVVPPVKRGPLLPKAGTPGACDGTFTQDLNARWTAKPGQNPGAGALVQAQWLYRDPLSTSNRSTTLSDAIEFPVGP
jgi:hypothetical protein